jgi:hypothetical protein
MHWITAVREALLLSDLVGIGRAASTSSFFFFFFWGNIGDLYYA